MQVSTSVGVDQCIRVSLRFMCSNLNCITPERKTRWRIYGRDLNQLPATALPAIAMSPIRSSQRLRGTVRAGRSKRPRLNIFAQHEMLMAAFPRPQPPAEDIPIYNGRGCTLLELSQGKCRWPISNPGAEDFCFCGNEPVKGLPYCLERDPADRRRHPIEPARDHHPRARFRHTTRRTRAAHAPNG
jgi:hypothetical protein